MVPAEGGLPGGGAEGFIQMSPKGTVMFRSSGTLARRAASSCVGGGSLRGRPSLATPLLHWKIDHSGCSLREVDGVPMSRREKKVNVS